VLPECFADYYQTRTKQIMENYNLAINFFDEDGVHDLRVEIKRLRAFFNLIGSINPKFNPCKRIKSIRFVFKAAGQIRDMHVLQGLVRDWMNKDDLELSEYYNYLKAKELDARSTFADSCSDFNEMVLTTNLDKIKKALASVSLDYIEFKTEQRLNSLLDELIFLKEKNDLAEEDYHKIRILAKETRYTLEVLQQCYVENDVLTNLNSTLRNLHRPLGLWHDNMVALQCVQAMLDEHIEQPLYHKRSYTVFMKFLEQDKNSYLQTFKDRWQSFLPDYKLNRQLREDR